MKNSARGELACPESFDSAQDKLRRREPCVFCATAVSVNFDCGVVALGFRGEGLFSFSCGFAARGRQDIAIRISVVCPASRFRAIEAPSEQI